jgi:mono/diheme cytochrome c family protein
MCLAFVAWPAGIWPALDPLDHSGSIVVFAHALQSRENTIWNGIYSQEQAARGLAYYRQSCGQCHGDDLAGGGDAEPPLAGSSFMSGWWGHDVADLFSVIAETMPFSAPGRLTDAEYVDILSYIFKANGIPAGPVDLSSKREELKKILVTRPAVSEKP